MNMCVRHMLFSIVVSVGMAMTACETERPAQGVPPAVSVSPSHASAPSSVSARPADAASSPSRAVPGRSASVTGSPASKSPKVTPSPRWPRVSFASLSFELPPGWRLAAYGSGDACAEPAHHSGTPVVLGCHGIDIQSGTIVGSEGSPYAAGQPGGWYRATDVQPCPVQPRLANGEFNGIVGGATSPSVESGLRPVGSHRAWYDRWEAVCRNGYRFSPQAWYLPVSHVLFLDYTGHAETSRILASVRFPS
jgi:hypothetical protein